MTLIEFLVTVRRRWTSVVVAVLLGVITAAVFTQVQTPMYRASSQVFVSTNGSDTVSDLSQSNTFSAARVKSYTALAVTPGVLGKAEQQLGLDAGGLSGAVTAEAERDTVLITITAANPDPQRAAAVANAVTAQLTKTVEAVEQNDSVQLVHMTVLTKATPPAAPFAPRVPVNVAIGLLAGLALGIAQALLREVLDTRLRSVDALTRITDASILGEFPVDESVSQNPLLDTDNRYTPRAEAFRQLRTQLTFTNLEGRSQSLVVTSACPGEGKSTTAVNLALTLTQTGAKVLLVDADLRRPKVGTYLGLESRVGLTTVLARQVSLDDAVQSVGDSNPLHVLTSGRVPPNPSELLGSEAMSSLVRELERRYDYVIVDAPPALPVTDPAILGVICTGVLLVVSMDGHIRRADLAAATERLERVGARVLGVALNKLPVQRKAKTYYNYEGSTPVSESPRRVSRERSKVAASQQRRSSR